MEADGMWMPWGLWTEYVRVQALAPSPPSAQSLALLTSQAGSGEPRGRGARATTHLTLRLICGLPQGGRVVGEGKGLEIRHPEAWI